MPQRSCSREQVVLARNVLVGPDKGRTVAAASAVEARIKATEEVMTEAASLVRGWFEQKE